MTAANRNEIRDGAVIMHNTFNPVRLAVLLAGWCLLPGCQKLGERTEYHPRVPAAVSSTQLAATEIVPTLDTPLGKSGNAVWCATFQVAWNRARDDVIGGPLRIRNAQPVADRLNSSPVSETVLPPGAYFAAAGRFQDGIADTIRREMARKFPNAPVPEFEGAAGFITYGYLETAIKFTTPFVDTRQPIEFSDAAGIARPVRAFSLHEGTDWDLKDQQAAQVRVLFSEAEDESVRSTLSAFALDLTADNAEQQVIIAVLPRAAHLRAVLDDLAHRIQKFAPTKHSSALQGHDRLAIPNVAFGVTHEFGQLQGVDKILENPGEFKGLFIQKAAQSIRFRLDKDGTTVISESQMEFKAEPRDFVVNRPFLILLKRRSSAEPFFAAWIENPELLDVIPKGTESKTATMP